MSTSKLFPLNLPFQFPYMGQLIAKHRPAYIPIAYKLAMVLTFLISTGMILQGVTIVSNQTTLLQNQIESFGQASANQLGDSSKELILSDDILGLMMVTENFGNNGNILGSAVYSEKGVLLTSSGSIPNQNTLHPYLNTTHDEDNRHSIDWQGTGQEIQGVDAVSFFTHIYFNHIIIGHALVTFSQETMNKAQQETVRTITISTVLMVMLGIIIAFTTGKRLSRPINNLVDASVAIGNGDYDHQLKERRNDEIGFLNKAFNQMTVNLFEKTRVENAFCRFMSDNIAEHILSDPDHVELGGKHVEGTVLFADIVGFTSFSENLPANEVLDMLNEYFSYISAVSRLYNGTIDKYMGDCAMILFGVPQNDANHKLNGLSCAVMIQKLMGHLNTIRLTAGKPAIHFRIGVNSGKMLAGNMGSQDKMQYTVVGDTVNLAARLQSEAKMNQIIITEQLFNDKDLQGKIMATELKSIRLRGIQAKVSTYNVEDLIPPKQTEMQMQINGILQRQAGSSFV